MNIDEIRRRNKEAGFHFFDPGTRRFFESRIGWKVYPGGYFVTSERGPDGVRRYTIRMAEPNGHIATIHSFQEYATGREAHTAIRRILRVARWRRTRGGGGA